MHDMWNFFSINGVSIIAILGAIIIFVMVFFRLFRASTKIARGFTTEVPAFVIPREKRGHTRPNGSEIRTVRLPNQCYNCGASLSQSNINWIGPLEAECGFCGSTVRAQLERI